MGAWYGRQCLGIGGQPEPVPSGQSRAVRSHRCLSSGEGRLLGRWSRRGPLQFPDLVPSARQQRHGAGRQRLHRVSRGPLSHRPKNQPAERCQAGKKANAACGSRMLDPATLRPARFGQTLLGPDEKSRA